MDPLKGISDDGSKVSLHIRRKECGIGQSGQRARNVYLMYILASHIKIVNNCGQPQHASATVFGLIKISGKCGTRRLHPRASF